MMSGVQEYVARMFGGQQQPPATSTIPSPTSLSDMGRPLTAADLMTATAGPQGLQQFAGLVGNRAMQIGPSLQSSMPAVFKPHPTAADYRATEGSMLGIVVGGSAEEPPFDANTGRFQPTGKWWVRQTEYASDKGGYRKVYEAIDHEGNTQEQFYNKQTAQKFVTDRNKALAGR